MTLTTLFSDLIVLEWGRRPAVRACASLLAQVGARVIVPRSLDPADPFSRFKTCVGDTLHARATALREANIVLFSSDRSDDPLLERAPPDLIVCDITVSADRARGAWTEPLLQAATGIADVTGARHGMPSISDAPVVELQTAILAAAGILAAWPRRVATGQGQTIALSLLDCGLNNLSSFLPLVFGGKMPRRSGNRHPMAVPWNSYRAKDGWVLLCSATDEHWLRLCRLMGREDLMRGAFEKLVDRVAKCDAVDAQVEAWTKTLTVKRCVAALSEAGLAAGPILSLEQLKEDRNLVHRGSIAPRPAPIPLSFLKTKFNVKAPADAQQPQTRPVTRPPLAGMLVLEIGQYTTAPVAAKQLALLGAEVIKIEPPGGEASRAWPPHQDGQGYFFTMNNANKRSCLLDLRDERDKRTFACLIKRADVLIENLKPGSLERLGFGTSELSALNPRLVYCAISGFGKESVFPGRPAFDTVVQAMSGLMDVTRADGAPVKLGISAADVTGGIAGFFAVMCGLEQRRRTGRGVLIDLSMQDVAVWVTQTAWNGAIRPQYCLLACNDGYVIVEGPRTALGSLADETSGVSRASLIDRLASAGAVASAVRTIHEIAEDPAIMGDGAVAILTGRDGKAWPLFRSPYRFSVEQTAAPAPIGALGEADAYVAGLCGNT